ncbi:MAG: ATP synthase F1 subunit epsilon [Gemmatimonadales bacterium]|nr:MAG: ATP synthase F1 subunit epsilon [Gemmatimonadales bacterium]
MAATLTLRVVSPQEMVFEGAAVSVVVPAWDGKMGILPGHAPMISLLGGGRLAVDLPGGGSEHFFLNRGVVKVENDQVTILSEYAGADAPPQFDPGSAWLDPADPAELSTAGNPLV